MTHRPSPADPYAETQVLDVKPAAPYVVVERGSDTLALYDEYARESQSSETLLERSRNR